MNRAARLAACLGAVLLTAAMPGCDCSCGAEPPGSTSAGDGGAGGTGAGGGANSSSSSGGEGGDGAQGGGGAGGGAVFTARRGASETVSAGEVVASPRYRMVFTLGQPTQNQETTASPKYRMRGGLIGAQESVR